MARMERKSGKRRSAGSDAGLLSLFQEFSA
jgi:hypothetical protein